MERRKRLSVVVPLYNEEENVRVLVDAVRAALGDGDDWELILVDDGSADGTGATALAERARDPRVHVLRLARNYGQTPALQAGFDHANGGIVVSMDGDLQNDPADIPTLVSKLEEGYDLVAGYRVRRQDRLLTRKVPSWVANRLIRLVTGVRIRDNGCSLKAYDREMLERVHLYSDMHRFIPAVAAATAGARIAEIPVRHHARRFGTSKYGLDRIGAVLADLLVINMIRSFRERPLVMFAGAAVIAMLLAAGFAVASVLSTAVPQEGVVAHLVFPGAALVWIGLACYLLLLGLVAEVALTEMRNRHDDLLPVLREEAR